MAMFDFYSPVPKLPCEHCGSELREWQGKAGPCDLFYWQKGELAPVGQQCDEQWKSPPAVRDSARLPKWFLIGAGRDVCGNLKNATGFRPSCHALTSLEPGASTRTPPH